MTEDLSNASWEEIGNSRQVIPVDGRQSILLKSRASGDIYSIRFNRNERTLLIQKRPPSLSAHSLVYIEDNSYLLLNPDFEGLKMLIQLSYRQPEKTLECRVVKKADNSLFSIRILQEGNDF
jgi:tRNA U34 2-thiouridine synthase MnmA/TrmU